MRLYRLHELLRFASNIQELHKYQLVHKTLVQFDSSILHELVFVLYDWKSKSTMDVKQQFENKKINESD